MCRFCVVYDRRRRRLNVAFVGIPLLAPPIASSLISALSVPGNALFYHNHVLLLQKYLYLFVIAPSLSVDTNINSVLVTAILHHFETFSNFFFNMHVHVQRKIWLFEIVLGR